MAPTGSQAVHAFDKMQAACISKTECGEDSYFASYQALTQFEIRKLWLAAGKQRGLELVDV